MRADFRISNDDFDFMIELDTTNKTWFKGTVVQIGWYDNEKDMWYQSKSSSELVCERANARVLFEFLWIWRGCWEGRIYFIDDEFWSSELEIMHKAWQEMEPILKAKMKEMDTDNLIFED